MQKYSQNQKCFRFLLYGVFVFLAGGGVACTGSTIQPAAIPSAIGETSDVTVVINPSLELAANGTVALLDTVNTGFRVYQLPELTLQIEQDSYENVFDVLLSSSGTVVGVRTMNDELEVITSSQRQSYHLPWKREQIRAMAISDTGDRVALYIPKRKDKTTSIADEGVLEIWPLPPKDHPLAMTSVPLYDQATLSANGDLSTLVAYSTTSVGNRQFSGVYTFDGKGKRITSRWTEAGSNLNRIRVMTYDDWVWAVQADGLIGWHDFNPSITLPGTLRDQFMISPTGSHLLVYRVVDVTDITTASILFRLFDLSSRQEIKRIAHVVEQYQMFQFILSKELALFAVRANPEGTIKISELSWTSSK